MTCSVRMRKSIISRFFGTPIASCNFISADSSTASRSQQPSWHRGTVSPPCLRLPDFLFAFSIRLTPGRFALSNPLPETSARNRVLLLSFAAFTLMFAVWLMLGILLKPIKEELKLTDSQCEWLLAVAILSGSLLRLNTGIWADKYGGRVVFIMLMLVTVLPTYLLSRVSSYEEALVCALLFGLAGNSFSAGISWSAAWFPPEKKGFAMGVFGAGNVGASGTKLLLLLIPGVLTLVPAGGYFYGMIPGGWRAIPAMYSVLLLLMAGAIYLWAPTPDRCPGAGRTMREVFKPLSQIRVWRLSLYYVVVFGAYVALSGWLPMFYTKAYGVSLREAALMTTLFIFPASLLRPVGGILSDKYGPRGVTYAVFVGMTICLAVMSVPPGTYLGVEYTGMGVWAFTGLLFLVGCGMGIGKASVYKYIPNYFPKDVGAVGGMVGMLGALGGFLLPKAFGGLGRATGVPQMAFIALLVLTVGSLAWLHLVIASIKASEREPVSEPVLQPAN